jgi:hypothetical protein
MKHLFFLFAVVTLANSLFANTYYISADKGSDSDPGTRDQPFKTISKGADMAQPGDTVFVLEGVYRERVAPPRGGTSTLPIVYIAEPGKQVFIKGSDVYDKSWTTGASGNTPCADLNQMQFTDDYYWDDANPFKVISAGNPFGTTGKHTLGQIFVDGEQYLQKESLASMGSQTGSWWYDSQNNSVYVNFKPGHSTSSLVEITTRRRVFAPHIMGLGYIHVIGFIIEHCGNQFPVYGQEITAQAGALGLRGGHHWLVRHNIIRYAAGIGLDCGTERDNRRGESEYSERFGQPAGTGPRPENNIIEYNYLLNNGCIGIAGIATMYTTIRGNVVMYNNNLKHNLSEDAGIKLHQCNHGLITGNYIADNYTYGIWLDGLYGGSSTRVTNNLIVHNSKGIKVEIGNYDFGAVLVDHNVLMNNVENQYYSHDASGVLVLNNLIAGTQSSNFGQGIYVQQVSDRSTSNSRKNAFYNNIICNNYYQYDILYPSDRGGEQRFLGNLYDKSNAERVMRINNMTNRYNQLEFSAAQFRQKVIEDVGGTLPNNAFINLSSASDIRANLTLDEWKIFWAKQTQHYDQDAEVMPGLTAVYDSATMTVRLCVPTELVKRNNSRWNADYKNTYQLTEEFSYPGPFDHIHAGLNTYCPYQGLVPVKPDELPPLPTMTHALSNLTVSQGTLMPAFNANIENYTVSVPSGTSSIVLTTTKSHTGVTVTGDGMHNLNIDDSHFNIDVTAEGDITKTYTVTVHRLNPAATLSNIIVNPGTLSPNFDANTTNYSVNVHYDVRTIAITGATNHSAAIVNGDGIKQLNTGDNPFEITVTEDGINVKTYNVTVVRYDHVLGVDANLNDLKINGNTVHKSDLNYMADCEENSVTLNLDVSNYANVTINGVPYSGDAILFDITENVTTLDIHITSETGEKENDYTLKIAASIAGNNLYYQRWGNIIAINRNTAHNGGFDVSGVRWYGPDGVSLGYGDYIKIQDEPENYYAEIKIGDKWHKVCAVNSRSVDKIVAYPNPVSRGENLRLQLPESFVGGTAMIYDIGGAIAKSKLSLPTKSSDINVSDLSSGIYLIHITGKNGAGEIVKIIIE